VVVLSGPNHKFYFRSFCFREKPFGFGKVKFIAVAKGQPSLPSNHFHSYRGEYRAVDIPSLQFGFRLHLREDVPNRNHFPAGNRDGNGGYPDILFVHAVSHPCFSSGRVSVSLLDSTHILGSVGFVCSPVTHGRDFTVDEQQIFVVESVIAHRQCQRPPELGRIVNGDESPVGSTLPPDFGISVNKAGGSPGCAPGNPLIGGEGAEGMFPPAHYPPIGEMVKTQRFILAFQRDQGIIPVGLFHPLLHHQRPGQQFITGVYKTGVGAAFIKGEAAVFFIPSFVIPDEKERTKGTVLSDFPDDPADAVPVIRTVVSGEHHAVVAQAEQPVLPRHIKTHPLVHDGIQVPRYPPDTRLYGSVGDAVYRKYGNRLIPMIAIGGSRQHRLDGRDMFP